jgi:general secretion pathway protein K
MRRSPIDRCAGRQGGFALLIVLWTLVLIALVVAHLASTARTEARISANLRTNAQAEALADGAVFETIFHLVDMSNRHWTVDDPGHIIHYDDATAKIRTWPLDGKINPNRAPPELLAALLAELGARSDEAQMVAAAIVDWRTEPTALHSADAKLAAYRAAGLDHGPPSEPFESVDEVARVIGVTPVLFRNLKPHMSIYPETGPDPQRADPVVARALQRLAAQSGLAGNQPARPPPGPFSGTAEIAADIATANGGYFTRYAVVTVKLDTPDGYKVLYWDRQPAE